MKLKENIAISVSGFLFDPGTGESFSVNSTGKEILLYISKGLTLSEIETNILSEYDVDNKTFHRYIDDFAHTLRRFNLIETEENE